jgi:hypothetical protein
MMRYFLCVLCVSASSNLIGLSSARADGWQFGGHAKYQYTYTAWRADDLGAVLGDDPANDQALDLRLKAENRAGAWDTAAHYELLAVGGDAPAARRRIAAAGWLASGTTTALPDDRRRLFDLTDEIADRERRAAVHRFDRLSLGHSTGGRAVRFGRQAVSWGNGLVFHPLDFVNPFSPIAIDKEYKTGDDMLYGQWLAGAGGDVQAIWVPRRDPATREVESGESSYAAKWRLKTGGFDLDLLAARHYDEKLAGVGVVKSVGGAVWRLDAAYTGLENDDDAFLLVTNFDYSWTWGGKNVYGYAEYFRNGVGETDRARYVSPGAALSARIARGELFTYARDYAAAGLQIEFTPLFNLHNTLIFNLNDRSLFLQVRGVYDWRQNTQLMAGVSLSSGERGTEYGGVPVPAAGAFLAPGRAAYLRLAYYF